LLALAITSRAFSVKIDASQFKPADCN